jgi:hypothetical protein
MIRLATLLAFKPIMVAALGVLAVGVVVVPGAQQATAHVSQEKKAVSAELWWRIYLYELDRGQWRSAGTFENPDRGRCIRYGEGWVAGNPNYRTYTGPVGFYR